MSRDLISDRSPHLRDVIEPRARANGAESSKAAARRARAWAPTHRDRILGVLWRPMIAIEIAKLTGLTVEQVDRRMPELRAIGDVQLTGKDRHQNGRQFQEWEKILL